jgi:hypothetical protein
MSGNDNGNSATTMLAKTGSVQLPENFAKSKMMRDIIAALNGHGSVLFSHNGVDKTAQLGLPTIINGWFSPEREGAQDEVRKGLVMIVLPFVRVIQRLDANFPFEGFDPVWESYLKFVQHQLQQNREIVLLTDQHRNAMERSLNNYLEIDHEGNRRILNAIMQLKKFLEALDIHNPANAFAEMRQTLDDSNGQMRKMVQNFLDAAAGYYVDASLEKTETGLREGELKFKSQQADGLHEKLSEGLAKLKQDQAALDQDREQFSTDRREMEQKVRDVEARHTRLSDKNTGLEGEVETLTEGLDVAVTDLLSLRDQVRGKSVKTISLKELEDIIDNIPSGARELLAKKKVLAETE